MPAVWGLLLMMIGEGLPADELVKELNRFIEKSRRQSNAEVRFVSKVIWVYTDLLSRNPTDPVGTKLLDAWQEYADEVYGPPNLEGSHEGPH